MSDDTIAAYARSCQGVFSWAWQEDARDQERERGDWEDED